MKSGKFENFKSSVLKFDYNYLIQFELIIKIDIIFSSM